MTKGVLVDFDGTLVNSEPLYFQAFSEVFQAYGHTIDKDEYYLHWSLMGEGSRGEIQRHGLTGIDPERVKQDGLNRFKSLSQINPVPLFPGAEDILIELPARGYRVIIASNSSPDVIRDILTRNGLQDLDIQITGSSRERRGKPHPDIFLAALKHVNLTAEQCVVIEDTLKGLEAATAAGIPCFIVKSSHYADVPFPGAIAVVNNLFEILELLPGHTR
jgi:HAD superfamily hydrolase (TIGR01509 family)